MNLTAFDPAEFHAGIGILWVQLPLSHEANTENQSKEQTKNQQIILDCQLQDSLHTFY